MYEIQFCVFAPSGGCVLLLGRACAETAVAILGESSKANRAVVGSVLRTDAGMVLVRVYEVVGQ